MKFKHIVSFFCLLAGICSIAYAQTGKPDLSFYINSGSPFTDGDIIITLGDSITQFGGHADGYVTLLQQAFAKVEHPSVTVINAGISGNEVPHLQARYENDVVAKNPTVVFIYIGINDVWHYNGDLGGPKTRFEKGLREIIRKMQQKGIRVVLATPSVIGEKADGTNPVDKSLDVFSDCSRKIAKDMHLELCDLRKAFIDFLKVNNPDGKPSGVLTLDMVHLNAAGNQLVAREAAKSIVAARKRKNVLLVASDIAFADNGAVSVDYLPKQNTRGILIRYTTDGSMPTAKSPVYKQPIKVDKTTTITALAFKRNKPAGFAVSAIAEKQMPSN